MSLIIDAGHGGTDPGATGNGIVEKVYNLEVSMYQLKRFEELGVPVKMTRTTDKTIPPNTRTNLVQKSGMKHCISNHVNAGGGDGVEVIHSIHNDGKLAKLISLELVAAGQNLRRVFSRKGSSGADYYYMHRQTGSVSTNIVEYGFLDSKSDDVRQLKMNQMLYAEAVVKAYCQYAGYKYNAPNIVKEVTPGLDAAADAALPDKVIKPSLKYNPDVKIVQTYLNYWVGGVNQIDIDGYFGPNTVKHLKAFQRSVGLADDGIYGPKTKGELLKFYVAKQAKEQLDKKPAKNNVKYLVQVGAFGDYKNAESLSNKLKKEGFSPIIKSL